MELINNILLGLTTALSFKNVTWCFVGVFLGTVVGVLPGLGPAAAVAILLPFTYSLGDPTATLILLAGIFYGAMYGGSITAILINLPGESASVITAMDGYAMSQKGRAGSALTIAAMSSFFAGTVTVVLIAAVAQPLTQFALDFGPAEYAGLMLLGIIGSTVLTNTGFLKGLAMSLIGILLGFVGTDVHTGIVRYNLGVPELMDGFPLIVLLLGLFGVGVIIDAFLHPRISHNQTQSVSWKDLVPAPQETKQAVPAAVRGTIIGSILGVLPGGGATISSIVSYITEKRISKTPTDFGKGAPAGVAGPEAANNAASQTSFIPLLTLGLPTHPIMALLASVMFMQNISPGPQVISNHPELFWGLIMSFWIGNLMLLILNLPLIKLWVSIANIPTNLLYTLVLIFCGIGAYSISYNWFHVWLLIPVGIVGYLIRRWKCDPGPLVMGFIVGKLFEEYFRRALVISHGDYTVFFTRPISLSILILTALLVFSMAFRKQ